MYLARSANGYMTWTLPCDPSYSSINKLYGLSHEEYTWAEAEVFCANVGGSLATFRTGAEAEEFTRLRGEKKETEGQLSLSLIHISKLRPLPNNLPSNGWNAVLLIFFKVLIK